MINFLNSIVDSISSVFSLIGDFIQGIVSLIGYIVTALYTVGEVVIYLPGDLKAIALAFIAVSVALLIAGRTGSNE